MEENMQALMERLNSSSQFLQSNDMRVTEVRHGFAKVEMIIDEQILNIHGFVHGGALFSLADTVAGAASFATGRDSVTLTGTINYIKPGRGGKLIGLHKKFQVEEQQEFMKYLSLMMKMYFFQELHSQCFS